MSNLRNIALVGHGDAGKTSLVEAILFKTGATTRLGEVEAGNTVCDSEPDEKERRSSIDAAAVYTNWKDLTINLIDAPGYADFIGEAISATAAVDSVFLCINPAAGIMINTRKMWGYTQHLPTVILLTKIDQENLRLAEVLASIKETFGETCLPLALPDGTGAALKTITNLLETPPEKLTGNLSYATPYREKLIESVVEIDDTLLNKYLEGNGATLKEITPDELARALRQCILRRKIIPIIPLSVKKDLGVTELINFIINYLPSPDQLPPKKGVNPNDKSNPAGEVTRAAEVSAPFSAQVFKSTSDPFVGKITYLRIFSGTLKVDDVVYNSRTGKTEKIAKLFKTFGKEQRPIELVSAGDIATIIKVENIGVGDTLSAATAPIQYPPLQFPIPMVSLAVEPKSKGDEQRLSTGLAKMADSDPTFKVLRDRQTNELVVSGLSNLHLDIILGRLKRRYDVQVTTKQPKIPYKETITTRSEANYKHKKQTGGRGQYGEVYLRIEPLGRGEGFQFVDDLFGGAIPNQFVPAIEKGVKEVLERGVIARYPVVDIKVAVYDGSYHVVDSSEAAFKIAASKAFQLAVKKARPMLLEPIVNIEITVPARYMGDITGDLNSRRARISGIDNVGGMQIIKATIPLAEIITYSTELRSITAGEGAYSIEFSHYDIVPQKIQEVIIARAQVKETQEEE
jgi:elongation factor G